MSNTTSLKNRDRVFQKTDGRCYYCGTHLDRKTYKNKDSFAIDHFQSKKHGGNGSISNLVPSCHYCNTVKKDYNIEEFRLNYTRIAILKAPYFSREQKEWLSQCGFDCDAFILQHPCKFYFECASNDGGNK